MKKRCMSFGLIAAVVPMAVALLWSARAQAQARGQIILTQTKIPQDLSGRNLQKFLRRNRVRVLKHETGDKNWRAYVSARLSRRPSVSRVNANGGKMHLAFYVKTKRRWTYVNVMDITYAPGAILQFLLNIPSDFGLTPGKQYQMRLTLLNASKHEVVFAKTNFKVK
ncbi:MAG: hypothetical protein J7M25_11735 [Deltaproteobacteria bacterium]|nr:hypothetical protein [Deltaproteobacteria bacterium]